MLKTLLLPLRWLYWGLLHLWYLKVAIEKRFFFQPYQPKSFVLSVGNLLVGGTGKTPLVSELLRFFQAQGLSSAVLSRGYGRKTKTPLVLHAPSSLPFPTAAKVWQNYGDEPLLIAHHHPKTSLLIGPDRNFFLRQVGDLFDLCLLDDGFQQLLVPKDLNLVVFDATSPLSVLALLPTGRLREPLKQIERADAVVLTRINQGPKQAALWQEKLRSLTTKPLFLVPYHSRILPHQPNLAANAPTFTQNKAQRGLAFCSIGSPKSFQQSLAALGITVQDQLVFPDHHPYQPKDIARILSSQAEVYYTTEKDLIRLQDLWPKNQPLVVLGLAVDLPEDFRAFLSDALGKRLARNGSARS